MSGEPAFATTAGRVSDRKNFEVEVQFRLGSKRAMVKVRDISPHGARVSGVFLVHEGDRFFLKLPSIEPIEATVAWVSDFEFGCKFERPINPIIFEAVTR